ncbi:MAG: nucleotidyltransferase domain-containing protein [Bacteroidetes bacterium]|nr:nucleotidyltransferase domain-containing protein [Bacteroidota bacterium]
MDIKLLKKNKVNVVFHFGSSLTGTVHPFSDIDIGVVFEDETIRNKKPVDTYGDLYEVFCKAFNVENPDIVYLRDAPLSLQFNAVYNGRIIYSVSPLAVADYKEEVMIKYFDFQYVENYFNNVLTGKSI